MELFFQFMIDETKGASVNVIDFLNVYSGGFPNLNHLFLSEAARYKFYDTIFTTNFDELLERALDEVELR